MGIRGRGARPLKGKRRERPSPTDTPLSRRKRPQRKKISTIVDKTELSRVERNIQWVECLPITSGLLAGQNFHVYPFQRPIFEGIYRTDDNGRRIVRQALITTPRKNGKTGFPLRSSCFTYADPRRSNVDRSILRRQTGIKHP